MGLLAVQQRASVSDLYLQTKPAHGHCEGQRAGCTRPKGNGVQQSLQALVLMSHDASILSIHELLRCNAHGQHCRKECEGRRQPVGDGAGSTLSSRNSGASRQTSPATQSKLRLALSQALRAASSGGRPSASVYPTLIDSEDGERTFEARKASNSAPSGSGDQTHRPLATCFPSHRPPL